MAILPDWMSRMMGYQTTPETPVTGESNGAVGTISETPYGSNAGQQPGAGRKKRRNKTRRSTKKSRKSKPRRK